MPDLNSTLLDIESIVHRHDRSQIDDLVSLLETSADGRILWAAAWSLGRLDATNAVPALEALLLRDVPNGSEGAAQALLRLGPDAVRERTVALLLGRGSIHGQLGGYHTRHPDVVPFVEPYCQSPAARIREDARRFVARHAQPRPDDCRAAGADEISSWLRDIESEESNTASNAAVSLARCPTLPRSAAIPLGRALARARVDDQNDPRAALAVALARTGDPKATSPLLSLLGCLEARSATVRALEILSIRSVVEFATPALDRLMEFPDEILCSWQHYDHDFGELRGISAVDMRLVNKLVGDERAHRGTAA